MAALTRAFSRVLGTQIDAEEIKTILIFCGVGLTVTLVLVSYGLEVF